MTFVRVSGLRNQSMVAHQPLSPPPVQNDDLETRPIASGHCSRQAASLHRERRAEALFDPMPLALVTPGSAFQDERKLLGSTPLTREGSGDTSPDSSLFLSPLISSPLMASPSSHFVTDVTSRFVTTSSRFSSHFLALQSLVLSAPVLVARLSIGTFHSRKLGRMMPIGFDFSMAQPTFAIASPNEGIPAISSSSNRVAAGRNPSRAMSLATPQTLTSAPTTTSFTASNVTRSVT